MEKRVNIEYLPIAEQDIIDIIQYILLDNPCAAISMANRFDDAISVLALFPHSDSMPNDIRLQSLKYRMLMVEACIVFYVFNNDFVEIRRVLHGKRKYNFLL